MRVGVLTELQNGAAGRGGRQAARPAVIPHSPGIPLPTVALSLLARRGALAKGGRVEKGARPEAAGVFRRPSLTKASFRRAVQQKTPQLSLRRLFLSFHLLR